MPDKADDVTNSVEQKAGRRWLIHLLGAFAVLAIILLMLLLITNSLRTFKAILYSPFSFAIMLIIVIEYIILKGTDRSRIYKLEIERLRSKRAEDISLLRDIEERLSNIVEEIKELESHASSQAKLERTKAEIKKIRSTLNDTIQVMRKKT